MTGQLALGACGHTTRIRSYGGGTIGAENISGPGAIGVAPDPTNDWIGVADMANATCLVDGCNKRVKARGWCNPHYMNWWRRGDPLAYAVVPTEAELFDAKVNRTQTCWLWTGAVDKVTGYGQFRGHGRLRKAHRVSYERDVGPIPAGLDLDHVYANGCRHRHCVRPDHLEPVTRAENLRRANSGKLTNEQRVEIAERFPNENRHTLAAEYGVTPERISQIGKAA